VEINLPSTGQPIDMQWPNFFLSPHNYLWNVFGRQVCDDNFFWLLLVWWWKFFDRYRLGNWKFLISTIDLAIEFPVTKLVVTENFPSPIVQQLKIFYHYKLGDWKFLVTIGLTIKFFLSS
jgi:hypothetical protein